MPSTQFNITDSRDLKALERLFKKAPRQVRDVYNATVNTQAFTHRGNIIDVVNEEMTVRSARFVRGSVRVEMAKGGRTHAIAGSIERPRFTGFEEQQTGKPSESNRKPTLAARGGNWSRKMTGKARLKPANNPITIRDIKGRGSRKQKTMSLLRTARVSKRPILVRRADLGKVRVSKRWEPGLYQFKRNKLLRTQRFGEPQTPKRIDWNGKALKRTAKSADFRRVFAEEFVRMYKKNGIKLK